METRLPLINIPFCSCTVNHPIQKTSWTHNNIFLLHSDCNLVFSSTRWNHQIVVGLGFSVSSQTRCQTAPESHSEWIQVRNRRDFAEFHSYRCKAQPTSPGTQRHSVDSLHASVVFAVSAFANKNLVQVFQRSCMCFSEGLTPSAKSLNSFIALSKSWSFLCRFKLWNTSVWMWASQQSYNTPVGLNIAFLFHLVMESSRNFAGAMTGGGGCRSAAQTISGLAICLQLFKHLSVSSEGSNVHFGLWFWFIFYFQLVSQTLNFHFLEFVWVLALSPSCCCFFSLLIGWRLKLTHAWGCTRNVWKHHIMKQTSVKTHAGVEKKKNYK